MSALRRFAWSTLVVNVAVVAWGAFVRATGSGAGCGRHWPTCQGAVIPRSPAAATVIEYVHRATSGIALLLVAGLAIWAFRALPRGRPARRASIAALAFVLLEAGVGAGLVLFGWVAKDTSPARGWVMAIHLANTFLLLASLALAARWSDRPGGLDLRSRAGLATTFAVALLATLFAGVTGAVAALGDTLFREVHFVEGFRMTGEATMLLRLRVLHPAAAVVAGAAILACARAALRARPDLEVRSLATSLAALVAAQILAGVVNVLLLAPVWLQLVHLVLADGAWIALVLLAAATLAPGAERAQVGEPVAAPA